MIRSGVRQLTLLSCVAAIAVAACSSASQTPSGLYAGTFSPTGSMNTARYDQNATLLSDGRVLITGGETASAELYDPKAGTFATTGSLTTARDGETATLLPDGRVLVAGGLAGSENTGYTSVASAELYDPKTGTFSPTGSMVTARTDQSATLLANGEVLIVGGIAATATEGSGGYLSSAELYDPKAGAFSPTGSMSTAREGQTATLLPDGRVVVAGGWAPKTAYASAELYDPKAGTFSSTGSMSTARYGQTATLLADGHVLITGGWNGKSSYFSSAELYNPSTGTFSPTGSMKSARYSHTATLLSDGRVMLAGGADGSSSSDGSSLCIASAETYDATTGTFTSTGRMTTPRCRHTATLLQDGHVLLAGGTDGTEDANKLLVPLASAELY